MLTIEKVQDARAALQGVARQTSVIHAPKLSADCDLYLKTENLQVTGSFKVRGAYYKMSRLSAEEKARGVVACSAGNHAQGVALAAKKNGIKSVICLPSGAPISKVEATKSYGAEVCLVDGVYDDAYQKAVQLQQEMGYTFLHPFDDEDVIAGQGTIALEVLEQLPELDAILVPIGGGGLVGGIAYTIKTLAPHVKVYGVEAAGAPSMYKSLQGNAIIELPSVATFADGIAVKRPGVLTYELCKQYVDEVVTVTEDEIAAAILALVERQKLIAEGAGATAVAAAMFNKVDLKGKKAVCVVSGGNIDVTILSRVINRGLRMSGRSCQLTIELMDKPGQLEQIARIVSAEGGNIISVHHERSDERLVLNGCYICVTLETRNFEHTAHIKNVLADSGFKVL